MKALILGALLATVPLSAMAFYGKSSNYGYWNLYKEPGTAYMFSYGLSSSLANKTTLSELNDTKKDFFERGFSDFSHFLKLYRSPLKKLGYQYEISFNKAYIADSKELIPALKSAGEFQLVFQVDNAKSDPVWFQFKSETTTHVRLVSTSKPINGYKMAETVLLNKLKSGKSLTVYLPNTNNEPLFDSVFSLKGFSKGKRNLSK